MLQAKIVYFCSPIRNFDQLEPAKFFKIPDENLGDFELFLNIFRFFREKTGHFLKLFLKNASFL
ncbi:hypothetical protein FC83_GL002331 [Agrilactobacillus composti DSM 18527 = JCM 14202]|uniref:Uncharacterized protein n=1 Tax=Agrilactobacillus composti DSM 18527 = JCM 14202 TaxID=1423734 RepID=A0A0R1XVV5_9LACO|nr:hypothetical protein FC83_GL002331 [Agrilactobacillus composti DSM 18527 = JCM 14202]